MLEGHNSFEGYLYDENAHSAQRKLDLRVNDENAG